MKFQKLLVIVASVCLLAVFGSESVHAQVVGAYGIFQGFCEDLRDASSDAGEELSEAANKLEDCYDDFLDCRLGIFGFNPGNQTCLGDFYQCQGESYQEVIKACGLFQVKIKEIFQEARQTAVLENVEFWFLRLVNAPTARSGLCIAPVLATIEVCTGVDFP